VQADPVDVLSHKGYTFCDKIFYGGRLMKSVDKKIVSRAQKTPPAHNSTPLRIAVILEQAHSLAWRRFTL